MAHLAEIASALTRIAKKGVCVREWPEIATKANPFCGAQIPPAEWELRPHQKGLWKAIILDGKRRAVDVAHRRCLAAGTRITLANGRRAAIESLRAGDLILSWNGEAIATDVVSSVWSSGVKEVVVMRARGHGEIQATADHRFGILSDAGKVSWMPPGGRGSAMCHGSPWHGAVSAADLAELVGYLVTDGHVCAEQSPKFTNTNEEIIDRCAELARSVFSAHPRKRRKGKGWDLHLTNGTKGGGETTNHVKQWFALEGALLRKRDLRLPSAVWTWDQDTLARFFSAVIDGDGSICVARPRVIRGNRLKAAASVAIHCGVSSQLAEDMLSLLAKMGISAWIDVERGTNHRVRISQAAACERLLSQIRTIGKEEARNSALAACVDKKHRKVVKGCLRAKLLFSGRRYPAETFDVETLKHHCFFANGYLVHNSGKDDNCLHIMAQMAWKDIGNYWYMLPEAEHARKVIWDAVNPKTGRRRIDEAFPPGYRAQIRENEMWIKNKRGSVIQLVGSDNYNRYVGSPPIGIVMSEAALADPAAWAYISPILEENGGWCIFNGTPRGKNHFKLFFDLACADPERWYSGFTTARDTPIFTPEQLKRILLEYQKIYGDLMGKALYSQEYLCSWDAPNVGAVYGDLVSEASGRIGRLPVEGISLVDTAWDIGGTTAIWFYQLVGYEVRLIDYYQQTGPGLDHYAEVLAKKGYKYGIHNFPFDVRLADGFDRVSILESLGIRVNTLAATKSIDDSIAAARGLFPRCHFDGEKCKDGIEALREYHRAWDDKLKRLSVKPVHDWSSHGSSAFEIVARAVGVSRRRRPDWEVPDYGIL